MLGPVFEQRVDVGDIPDPCSKIPPKDPDPVPRICLRPRQRWQECASRQESHAEEPEAAKGNFLVHDGQSIAYRLLGNHVLFRPDRVSYAPTVDRMYSILARASGPETAQRSKRHNVRWDLACMPQAIKSGKLVTRRLGAVRCIISKDCVFYERNRFPFRFHPRSRSKSLRASPILPPYVFGRINKMKYDKRVAGIDIIDLGMGNPTDPTPASVVRKVGRGGD